MACSPLDEERWWEAAREQWPELQLGRARFLAHLRLHQPGFRGEPRAGDLYLAAACLAGEAAALRVLERLLRACARDDDARAELTARLLVGPSPRLAEFGGRGALQGWLRLVARRHAIDASRTQTPLDPLDEGELSALVSRDPELSLAARGAGAALAVALRAAFRALPARDRRLLRAHHLEGRSQVELAREAQVPRSTLSAHLARAARLLLEGTRARLTDELSVSARDLDRVLETAADHLDATLRSATLAPPR